MCHLIIQVCTGDHQWCQLTCRVEYVLPRNTGLAVTSSQAHVSVKVYVGTLVSTHGTWQKGTYVYEKKESSQAD